MRRSSGAGTAAGDARGQPRRCAARPARVRLLVAGLAVLLLGRRLLLVRPADARSSEVAPDRNADGIVVLTGGAFRINDALELLAAGAASGC